MIPRKRIDIGWADLACGLCASLVPGDVNQAVSSVEAAWHTARADLACLSVRSGLDALLSVLQLPAGSEVLVSALTIPDMARIVEAHGLTVAPLEFDLHTLALTRDTLARAVSPRTRVLLVAHLFGSRMPMREIADFCHKNHILLIEDCAQAYTGDGWRGEVTSDVCLFSFGPIKTATALGGAIMTFRDVALRDQVRAHMSNWPLQSRALYVARLLKYACFVMLGYRPCYTAFVAVLKLLGLNHEQVLSASVRGFAGGDLFRQIRRRPAPPLLALLRRRIAQGVQPAVAPRNARARQLAALLADLPGMARPGAAASWHVHWVFPVLHPRADALMAHLQAQGFDATRGASSMAVVGSGEDARVDSLAKAFAQLCYLPAHEGMSEADIERLAAAVRHFESGAMAGNWRAA